MDTAVHVQNDWILYNIFLKWDLYGNLVQECKT